MKTIIKTSPLNYKNILSYPAIEIPTGETTFIQGESGCGKSTLFKLINGTLTPSKGSIYYKDNDILSLDTISLRRDVLLASQDIYLFSGTIEENFKQYYKIRELPLISSQQMEYYLDICCLNHPLNSDCEILSGGERQRVFLSILLSFKSPVLMLDEPTSALDEDTAYDFFMKVTTFCNTQSITLLIICHNPKLAKQFANNIITLEKKDTL